VTCIRSPSGPDGPILLQDHYLIEQMANFNRERIFREQLYRPIGSRESWAVFSPDRRWRYRLLRVWDSDKPRLAWVILNGSDADEHRTDPTLCRCIGFARACGYGGVDIANLYGWCRRIPGRLGTTSIQSAPTTIATTDGNKTTHRHPGTGHRL
jgi:hypothetical protein